MSYEEVHKALVDKLKERGIWYQYSDRLPLFFLWDAVKKQGFRDDWEDEVKELIEAELKLRQQGLEPVSKLEQYV